jgi:hypothetical protein
MGNVSAAVLSVIAGVIGLAVVAVIVSKNAQTSNVLQGAGSALSSVISAAVGPVTGSTSTAFGANSTSYGSLA